MAFPADPVEIRGGRTYEIVSKATGNTVSSYGGETWFEAVIALNRMGGDYTLVVFDELGMAVPGK